MITVRKNDKITRPENFCYHSVYYPQILGEECLGQLSTVNTSVRNLSLSVAIRYLTGITMGTKLQAIGSSAVFVLKPTILIFTHKTDRKKIKVNASPGSLLIFGSFFREEWKYTLPKNTVKFYQLNPLSYIYLSTQDRFKYAKNVKKLLQNIEDLPIWDQCVQKHLDLSKMLGSGSYGNVYLTEINGNRFATKLSKLKPEALAEPYSKTVSSWFEVHILTEIIRPIIQKNICQNLPLLYDNFVCKKCILQLGGKDYNHPCVTTIVELAEGDLKHYLKNANPTLPELYSALFQIMAALHAIQLHGQIMNFDVKKENVLYYRVDSGGYWHYKIHGKNFYVPNYGYMFVLNDFGISRPMSPKYPLYKTSQDLTFRLGSRYGVIIDKKITPLEAEYERDEEGETAEPQQVTWVGKDYNKKNGETTQGCQFRMYRKNDKVLPVKLHITEQQKKYLVRKRIGIDYTKHKFFLSPEVIPPFEFYNDTQDGIRMFIGGKRSTQRGYHKCYDTIPKKLIQELLPYNGPGESMDERIFTENPSQLLAGYFIENFFRKNTGFSKMPKSSRKLASYIMS